MGLFTSDKELERDKIRSQLNADKELAEFTFNQNLAATRDERAYNTPAMQLSRLKDAGLNPLYFGLDGNSSNGSPFSMSTPSVDVGSISQAIQSGNANLNTAIANTLTAAKTMAEVRQMDAQTEMMQHQQENIDSQTRLNNQELTLRPTRLGSELEVNGSIVRLNDSNVNVNSEKVQNLKQEYLNMQKTFDKLVQEINESKSREKENLATIPVLQNQAGLLSAQKTTESYKQQNLVAQTGLYKAQEGLTYEQQFEQQVHNGYLPKEMLLKLGIMGQNFQKQQEEINNLKIFGKVLDTQNLKEKFYMYVDGVKVGLFKDDNGQIRTDNKDFVDYWKDMRVSQKLKNYADIYRDIVGSGRGNDLGAILGSIYMMGKAGFFKPSAVKSVGVPPPNIYY